jgi:hypothetical protein
MKKHNIIIIGSGITGIAIAYILCKKGHNVKIYENKSLIGGIMHDVNFDQNTFLSGPFFFQNDNIWLKEFLEVKENKKIFNKFNLSYGSYSDIFSKKKIIRNDYAHPATNSKFKKIQKIKTYGLLINRLRQYQPLIKNRLLMWLSKTYTKFDLLHEECAAIIGIHRILFTEEMGKIRELKKKNPLADELLGLPNNFYTKQKYLIPKNNFNDFFNNYKKFLEKKGVQFFLNKKISLEIKNKEIIFYSNRERVDSNESLIVWAANPIPLFRAVKKFNLENSFQKINLIFSDIKKISKKLINKYIQVYSLKNKIIRIYIYKIKNITKLTAEFSCEVNNSQANNHINNLLKYFDKDVVLSGKIYSKKILKHHLITKNDFLNLKKLSSNKLLIKNNVICGSWEKFYREDRIKSTIERIENFEKKKN